MQSHFYWILISNLVQQYIFATWVLTNILCYLNEFRDFEDRKNTFPTLMTPLYMSITKVFKSRNSGYAKS